MEKIQKKTDSTWASILAIISVFYAISPFDIIPDIPVIGWVDDFFVVSAAMLNLLEKTTGQTHHTLRFGIRAIKWTVVVLGIIAVALLALLGTVLYNLFTS